MRAQVGVSCWRRVDGCYALHFFTSTCSLATPPIHPPAPFTQVPPLCVLGSCDGLGGGCNGTGRRRHQRRCARERSPAPLARNPQQLPRRHARGAPCAWPVPLFLTHLFLGQSIRFWFDRPFPTPRPPSLTLTHSHHPVCHRLTTILCLFSPLFLLISISLLAPPSAGRQRHRTGSRFAGLCVCVHACACNKWQCLT